MRAIGFEEHGSLDCVRELELAVPPIAANEVLLSVKAAALNRLDLWVLAGWPSLRLKLPHIMGSDGSGVVAAVGDQVRSVRVGDRVAVNPTLCNDPSDPNALAGNDNMCADFAVLGEHVDGFYAEFIAVPERNLLPLPDDVSFEAAAAVSLVFVTAWHSLITRGQLRPGESVLVIGAGGGVNTAAIQVARLAGASPIIVVGSSEDKLALVRELGADITINRHEAEWPKAVYLATDRQGVDVVVDNVGAATFPSSLKALRRGGRLLTVGNSSGWELAIDNRYIFGKHLSIIGSTMGTTADFRAVMGQIFAGRLQPVIDTVYRFEDVLVALKRLREGDVRGKLVLTLL